MQINENEIMGVVVQQAVEITRQRSQIQTLAIENEKVSKELEKLKKKIAKADGKAPKKVDSKKSSDK